MIVAIYAHVGDINHVWYMMRLAFAALVGDTGKDRPVPKWNLLHLGPCSLGSLMAMFISEGDSSGIEFPRTIRG